VRADVADDRLTSRFAEFGPGQVDVADLGPARVKAAMKKVDAAEEAVDEGVGRAVVDRLRRADLLDFPLVHHHHLVGDLQGLLLVVGDEDAGDVNLVVQTAQPAAQLQAHLGVEGAEGLIEQEHLRLDRGPGSA
jgi:hypothetical protein